MITSLYQPTLNRIRELILESSSSAEKVPSDRRLFFEISPIEEGFISETIKLVIITVQDIYNRKSIKYSKRKSLKNKEILSFLELKSGDYVVHENHGDRNF
jgi:Transcription-repair coupling factor (superfamily II helicase)